MSPEPGGALVCPGCGGAAVSEGELDPPVRDTLVLETREKSGAFVKQRHCPSCDALMAPWRIGQMEAWIERCPTCDIYWLEPQDRRTVTQLARHRVRAEAVRTLKPAERAELARDLAAATASEYPMPLSPLHAMLAAVGLPVVTRKEGDRTPYATWGLALLLLTVLVTGRARGDAAALVNQLGYHSAAPTLLSALTAGFVHFGWLHLLGNLYFLLAFGDGVEQRLPSWAFLASFVAASAASIFFEGALSSGPELIAGASGGIAALMGACMALQPKAKVLTSFAGRFVSVPIWVYGLFELGYQAVMLVAGVPGAAWTAHLTGLAMGVALGFAVRRRRTLAG